MGCRRRAFVPTRRCLVKFARLNTHDCVPDLITAIAYRLSTRWYAFSQNYNYYFS